MAAEELEALVGVSAAALLWLLADGGAVDCLLRLLDEKADAAAIRCLFLERRELACVCNAGVSVAMNASSAPSNASCRKSSGSDIINVTFSWTPTEDELDAREVPTSCKSAPITLPKLATRGPDDAEVEAGVEDAVAAPAASERSTDSLLRRSTASSRRTSILTVAGSSSNTLLSSSVLAM
jgi:hypothetical protein